MKSFLAFLTGIAIAVMYFAVKAHLSDDYLFQPQQFQKVLGKSVVASFCESPHRLVQKSRSDAFAGATFLPVSADSDKICVIGYR